MSAIVRELARTFVAEMKEDADKARALEVREATLRDLEPALAYSRATIDGLNVDMQVEVTRVVPELGGDFVDALPLPPGKVIRFEHPSRPGYRPTAIELGVSMANGDGNVSDLEIQFYLVGGDRHEGRRFGPKYRGEQLVDRYGAPIKVPWPLDHGRPPTVGSLERLAVEVRHWGFAHQVNSICVTVFAIAGIPSRDLIGYLRERGRSAQ